MRRIGPGHAAVKQRAADEHRASHRVVRRSTALVLLAEQRPVSAVAEWARQQDHAPSVTKQPNMHHAGCVKPNSQIDTADVAAR